MKDLKRIIKDRTCLIFIDLEATQVTHEMIQIGAYKTYLNPDLTIKKVFRPFEMLVKPKHRVGKIVTDLTGLTDYKVKTQGVTYRTALLSFKAYCGKDFDRCLFVVYGNSDGSIFRASAENNMDASMPLTMSIVHRIFDFCGFAFRYIKGDDGNPLSLSRMVNLFSSPFDGHAHSALDDAKNLMHVYQAFLKSPAIVKREYKKVLALSCTQHAAVKEVITRLTAGKTVTPNDFEKILDEALK